MDVFILSIHAAGVIVIHHSADAFFCKKILLFSGILYMLQHADTTAPSGLLSENTAIRHAAFE